MNVINVADQYFTIEERAASFKKAQKLSNRRASTASTKGSKSLKWPHKFLSAEELAKAGFFYYPTQENPDNTTCFLCHKSIDGWEKGDDPVVEHVKHSPDCGWAIVAAIEVQDGVLSEENPASSRMIEARAATFADKWPHEHKKGWKCKTKQLVDAGWKYTPTLESDDMATCTYCGLALDGWDNSDKPLDEHIIRSPDCTFFSLINSAQSAPVAKSTKAKKGRASKASRLSTQSSLAIASEAPSFMDQTAGEGDSILTTATTATSKGRKGVKGKKAPAAKAKKVKKEVIEVMPEPEAEPEDDEFDVKVDTPPKANRGKKRKSLEVDDAPAPESILKRRNTRARGSTVENSILDDSVAEADTTLGTKCPKAAPKKGRGSVRKSSRKASTISVASIVQSEVPDDAEIEQKLLEDLEGPVTDDEGQEASVATDRKATGSSKITKSDHPVFGIGAMDIDEAAIEAELEAMEVEFRPLSPLPKAKGAKGKQPRKPSAKQQAAAKRAAEAEAAAQKAAEEEEEASQQVVGELEQSIIQQSSPVTLLKGPHTTSRQPGLRGTNASEISLDVIENNLSLDNESHEVDAVMKSDSGNETHASVASQSTVVRGSKARRGSTLKKGKKGKKVASRNIEEIVRKEHKVTAAQDEIESPAKPTEKVQEAEEDIHVDEAVEEETSTMSEALGQVPALTSKAAKNRTRTGKAEPGPIPEAQETITMAPSPSPIRTRTSIPPPKKAVKVQIPRAPSPTPPPNEATPTTSPQSSDAENQPPSSKPSRPSDTVKKTAFATPGHRTHIALTTSTPQISPSKRNVIAGLQSEHPWTAVDLDLVFLKSPADENAPRRGAGLLDEALEKAKTGNLTSPEKRMTVEEWIQHNASSAEEKFRNECERMVNVFEKEGGRAMKALEGVLTE